jgi:ABC-type spermidine/putrescine transport system permease subunit I
LEHYIHLFTVPLYLERLAVTLRISLIVAVACVVLGYPVAYLLTTAPSTIRNVILIMVVTPLWVSILVRTYTWIVLLGRAGLINQALMSLELISSPVQFIYNFLGVFIGMVHVLLPYAILPIYSVMSGIDRDLLKAAENLGANPFRAFMKVFFPLSLPGVAGSLMLIFMMSLGFYVTPLLLGSPAEIMVANLIDVQVTVALQWGFGAAISVALLVSALIIITIYNRYLGLDQMLGGLA